MDPAAPSPDGAPAIIATIRALAGVDTPEARATLVAFLDADPAVASAAATALGACGPAALNVCIAAVRQPSRTRFAALALAHLGPDGRAATALLRALPGAAPATRLAIAAALHRAPHQAPAAISAWLRSESDPSVALVLVDLLGRHPPGALDASTVAFVASLARTSSTSTPAPIRALATWAASAHGVDDLIPIAVDLLSDPVAGPIFAAVVARRGGPLAPLVDGFAIHPGLDRASSILDDLSLSSSPSSASHSHLPRSP